MYQKLSVKLTGVSPLVVHSGQMGDPLNQFAVALKKITSKRKKTEADHEDMSRLEFEGGFYVNEKGHPIMPGINLEAMIRDGAKVNKRGRDVKAGVIVAEDPEIQYDGPKTVKELWKDKRFVLRVPVKMKTGTMVMRTRPWFTNWSLKFDVEYLPDVIDKRSVIEALQAAGQLVALGTWRPRNGRFQVEAS